MDCLLLKYFVLKPNGDDKYAKASRAAMLVYAKEIADKEPKFAADIIGWVKAEEMKADD